MKFWIESRLDIFNRCSSLESVPNAFTLKQAQLLGEVTYLGLPVSKIKLRLNLIEFGSSPAVYLIWPARIAFIFHGWYKLLLALELLLSRFFFFAFNRNFLLYFLDADHIQVYGYVGITRRERVVWAWNFLKQLPVDDEQLSVALNEIFLLQPVWQLLSVEYFLIYHVMLDMIIIFVQVFD